MKSISSDYLKIILILLFIFFAQSAFAEEKCALPHQLTDSSKKIHCLGKFDFSKRKYSNFNMTLDRAARASNCWSLAIPIEESCNNIIGFSAREPQWCMAKEMRIINNDSALSMCQFRGCKCSLVIEANDIVDSKLFFSYAMRETELVVHNNTEKEAKESINNKSELKNSQPENNQSIINAEKEKQAQQDLKLAQDLKAIEDVKAKAQQELKLAQEAKAREDAISEARQKAHQELRLAQEAKAREDAISDARQKAQQELRQSQEAEARAAALEKLKQEEYQKEKNSAAAKARVLEEIKAEAYAKERAILEAKAKAQADLKAEEIANIQAEEQAKAQALIDEKNRVDAAKAAVEQAKKNREQEIAEEKTKIAESQKKIEELKTKPLDIENSKLDKPLPKSASNNNYVLNGNSTAANTTSVETGKQKILIPIFTFACSAGGGEPWYRIVSNGTDIFFASIRSGADKGYEIQVTERQIKFKLKSGSDIYGSALDARMEINRDNLSVFSKTFVDKKIYPPDGFHEVSYKCQLIEDTTIFDTLKNRYESSSADAKKRKQEYDSRPNKI